MNSNSKRVSRNESETDRDTVLVTCAACTMMKDKPVKHPVPYWLLEHEIAKSMETRKIVSHNRSKW